MTTIRHTIFRTVPNRGIPGKEIKTFLSQLNIFLLKQLWRRLLFTHSLAVQYVHCYGFHLIKVGTLWDIWLIHVILRYIFLFLHMWFLCGIFKSIMVSLHPAPRQYFLSSQYSHDHFFTRKLSRNYFTCFSRKAIKMEKKMSARSPSLDPHRNQPAQGWLPMNNYLSATIQLTSFLL